MSTSPGSASDVRGRSHRVIEGYGDASSAHGIARRHYSEGSNSAPARLRKKRPGHSEWQAGPTGRPRIGGKVDGGSSAPARSRKKHPGRPTRQAGPTGKPRIGGKVDGRTGSGRRPPAAAENKGTPGAKQPKRSKLPLWRSLYLCSRSYYTTRTQPLMLRRNDRARPYRPSASRAQRHLPRRHLLALRLNQNL